MADPNKASCSRSGLVALSAVMALALVACANPAGNQRNDDGEQRRSQGTTYGVVATITTQIVARLNQVWRECEAQTAQEYHVDCLSEGYVRAAAIIPADPIFIESRAIILSSAARLQAVADANSADELPRVSGGQRLRPLVPVRPERLAAANAEALRIIEETETILLRSSRSPQDRQLPYQQIAEALGSSKSLLRS